MSGGRSVNDRGTPRGQSEPIAEQRRPQPNRGGETGGAEPVSLPGIGGRLHFDLRLDSSDGLALLQDSDRRRPACQQRLQIGATGARSQRERHEYGVTLWERGDSALVDLAVKGVATTQVDGVVFVTTMRGRGCIAREPAADGADGGPGEPGHHRAAEHAPARYRRGICRRLGVVGGLSQLVVSHCQLAETTF